MFTSQLFSGCLPTAVSVAIRECHNGGAARLVGDHEVHDCNGKVLVATDITETLKQGGTCVYCCMHRDVNDPKSWIFRNTTDLSLQSDTRVAKEMREAAGMIFRKMFRDSALKSTMDCNALGYIRLCQVYQAVKAVEQKRGDDKRTVDVRVYLSGVRKKCTEADIEEIKLTGNYVQDLELVKSAKKKFTAKAVGANASLALVLAAAGFVGKGTKAAPAALVRVANNALVPVEELAKAREKSGAKFPYATVDVRGHMLVAYPELPSVENAVSVPGQVESCVNLMRNVLAAQANGAEKSSAEVLIRYIDGFLPRRKKNTTVAGTSQCEGEDA